MPTTPKSTAIQAEQRASHLDGLVTLQALWTIVALVDPGSVLLVWLSVPAAYLVMYSVRRVQRLRMPTVVNQAAHYLQMLLCVGVAQFAGGDEFLRLKIGIVTAMTMVMAVTGGVSRRRRRRAALWTSVRGRAVLTAAQPHPQARAQRVHLCSPGCCRPVRRSRKHQVTRPSRPGARPRHGCRPRPRPAQVTKRQRKHNRRRV